MATTDVHKILDTVSSRCFQVLFNPISQELLRTHLQVICKKEHISASTDGLNLIINQTQGSARDAINLLEQVRFSHGSITKEAVVTVLGYIDTEYLIELLACVLIKSSKKLVAVLNKIDISRFSPDNMWNRIVELLRVLIWIHYGVQEDHEYKEVLNALMKKISIRRVHVILQALYDNELIFQKTTSKHIFMQMLFLRLVQDSSDTENGSAPLSTAPASPDETMGMYDENEGEENDELEDEEDEDEEDDYDSRSWRSFLAELDSLNEPLINSIFKQGTIGKYDPQTAKLDVSFTKELIFFNDWLHNTKALWFPLLQKHYGHKDIELVAHFNRESVKQVREVKNQVAMPVVEKVAVVNQVHHQAKKTYATQYNKKQAMPQESISKNSLIDISDVAQWKKAHLLLQFFPGTIHEVI